MEMLHFYKMRAATFLKAAPLKNHFKSGGQAINYGIKRSPYIAKIALEIFFLVRFHSNLAFIHFGI